MVDSICVHSPISLPPSNLSTSSSNIDVISGEEGLPSPLYHSPCGCVLLLLSYPYPSHVAGPFCIVYFWPQSVDLIQEPHTHAYNNFLFNEQFTVIKIHLGYSIKRVRVRERVRERVWARITRVAARISIVN